MKRSLRSWLWRVPIDDEIDEELDLHVEIRTRELIARGMDPQAARARALERLGDVDTLKRTMAGLARKRDREMHLTLRLEEFWHDLKFAFRQLRHSPGFTLVATLTLALGIGANSAIFALVDATLLRPLPYREPDRLVAIWERTDTNPRRFASPLNMLDWNTRSATFEKIAGFVPSVGGMVMAGADGNAETVSRQWVTSGIFDVLGVTPIAGRTFSAEDEAKRADVVVLSEALWRTRFNADPGIIGRELRLDGSMWTVVGVVPDEFQLLGETSMWAMRSLVNLPPRARGAAALQVVGRMKPGVSLQAAQSDLGAVAATLATEFPETNKGRTVALERLHDSMIGSDLRLTSMLFLGVVAFVLLICCANVASLLLARATVRMRELAVRSALGAGRRRIIRQLLTESIVLSLIGGALGTVVGAAILSVAPSLIPQGLLPPTVALTFDLRVVAFCAVAALVVGVLFGVDAGVESDPVLVRGSDGLEQPLRHRRRRPAARAARHGRSGDRRAAALRRGAADADADGGGRLRARLPRRQRALDAARSARFEVSDAESLLQFYDQVEAEIAAVPGVAAVAFTSTVPLDFFDESGVTYEIVGDPPVSDAQRPRTETQAVSATYFSTLDLPIVAGRPFERTDTRGRPLVCIVNEAFARSLGGRPAVGRRVALRSASAPQAKPSECEIVGVARQVKARPDEASDFVQLYVPLAQDLSDDVYLVIRPAAGRAEALTPSVRAAISRVDKEQLVSVRDIRTLDDIAWTVTARHRFRAVLVVAFAVLALVLAMVGVFGILAYSVQQHVRDFGVRRALGATTADILRLVMVNAARVIATGVVIGLAMSAIFGRLIETMLFGVRPLDLATFAFVTVVLGVTAAIAIAGPAWRAARVEPAAALRSP